MVTASLCWYSVAGKVWWGMPTGTLAPVASYLHLGVGSERYDLDLTNSAPNVTATLSGLFTTLERIQGNV